MAKTGDTFTITLKRPHLEWGSYRHTNSRGIVYGEGYIPIPAPDAYRIGTFNSNGTMVKIFLDRISLDVHQQMGIIADI